jgi:hypothetical protein
MRHNVQTLYYRAERYSEVLLYTIFIFYCVAKMGPGPTPDMGFYLPIIRCTMTILQVGSSAGPVLCTA